MATTSVALVLLGCFTAVYGFSGFLDNIPNGRRVPHPCQTSQYWMGVGHNNPDGGGPRNPFGLDFAYARYQWTKELCEKDSDGDGKSNGAELGDPYCNWQPGNPSPSGPVTHPGVCDPSYDPVCRNKVSPCPTTTAATPYTTPAPYTTPTPYTTPKPYTTAYTTPYVTNTPYTTPKPYTTAPYTTAPYTTAPYTTAPYTTAPYTTAPYTTAPYTSAPYTTAPYTTARYTSAPYTTATYTTAPYTTAPYTSAPYTSAPYTTAPYTTAQYTTAPYTTAPYTTAPYTSAPYTTAPYTNAPYTNAQYTTQKAYPTGNDYQPTTSYLPPPGKTHSQYVTDYPTTKYPEPTTDKYYAGGYPDNDPYPNVYKPVGKPRGKVWMILFGNRPYVDFPVRG